MRFRDPILIPEQVRASEVRAFYHGCGLRQFYDWAVEPLKGYAWFHAGTGMHSAVEAKLEDDSLDLEDMEFIALDYYYGKCRDDEEAGLETRHSNKFPDRDAVEGQVTTCLTNFLRSWTNQRYKGYALYATELELVNDKPPLRTTVDGLFCKPSEGPDGGIIVVDWKTGQSNHADPIQLYIYRWGLETMGYDVKGGWFHHLYSDTVQEIDWDLYDPLYIKRLLEATDRAKRARRPPMPTPGWYCKSICPYKSGCPEFSPGIMSDLEYAWEDRQWTDEKVES